MAINDDDDDEKLTTSFSNTNLPPEALGMKVYLKGIHIGFLINSEYGNLMELREKIKAGKVNEDGV